MDWYHLVENLHKVGGSIKRLNQAETLLSQGQVQASIELFNDYQRKPAKNFCEYLRKHQHRIVNYKYFQAEGLYSIGSGAVESAIKQIGRRVQLSGAQWKRDNVPNACQVESVSRREQTKHQAIASGNSISFRPASPT